MRGEQFCQEFLLGVMFIARFYFQMDLKIESKPEPVWYFS